MLFCIGFCASASLNCIAALLLDLYVGRAGTVTASNNLLRCLLGAGATAATVPMINGVGIGWAMTIFGLLNTGDSEGRRARREPTLSARKESCKIRVSHRIRTSRVINEGILTWWCG